MHMSPQCASEVPTFKRGSAIVRQSHVSLPQGHRSPYFCPRPYPKSDWRLPERSVSANRPPYAPHITPATKVPVAPLHQSRSRLFQDVNCVTPFLCVMFISLHILSCMQHEARLCATSNVRQHAQGKVPANMTACPHLGQARIFCSPVRANVSSAVPRWRVAASKSHAARRMLTSGLHMKQRPTPSRRASPRDDWDSPWPPSSCSCKVSSQSCTSALMSTIAALIACISPREG